MSDSNLIAQTDVSATHQRFLIDEIIKSTRHPTLDGGRNIRLGYLRGWGIEFGGLGRLLEADPLYKHALSLCQKRFSVLQEPKLQNLFLLIRYCLDGTEGNIVEFGSYRGGSSVFMGAILKGLSRRTRVFALDTYSGMPPTDRVRDLHLQGDFDDTSFGDVRQFLEAHDLSDFVVPVKGEFEESFPDRSSEIGEIALAHIDCDIYSAVKYSMRVTKAQLHEGGYLVFDDPLHGSCLGAMQAIEEDLYHAEKLIAEQVYPHLVFRYPPVGTSLNGHGQNTNSGNGHTRGSDNGHCEKNPGSASSGALATLVDTSEPVPTGENCGPEGDTQDTAQKEKHRGSPNDDLRFTGERYLPEVGGPIRHEHLHRYALCLDLVLGKRVLDIASGEGYGSASLAKSADSVIGVDIDEASIRHARKKYGSIGNLSFRVGGAEAIPLDDASIDVAVCFETIEHIEQHESLLSEIRRVLSPEGLLIISTPDKQVYSDFSDGGNEYHVRELTRDAFGDLLHCFFRYVDMGGQRLGTASFVFRLETDPREGTYDAWRLESASNPTAGTVRMPEPVYIIALCSNSLEVRVSSSVFADPEDDLYAQGTATARWAKEVDFARADALAERDIARRDRQTVLAERDAAVRERDIALNERRMALTERDAVRHALEAAFVERDAAFAERRVAVSQRDSALREKETASRERDFALQEREAASSDHAKAMAGKATAVAARDAAFAERDAAMKQWHVALQARNEAMEARDTDRATLSRYEDSLFGGLAALGTATWRTTSRTAGRLRRLGSQLVWLAGRELLGVLPFPTGVRSRVKNATYRRFPSFFAGTPGYRAWAETPGTIPPALEAPSEISDDARRPMDLAKLSAGLEEKTRTSRLPKASIIIPACGHISYTIRCLESIAETASQVSFEVIVVDDASPDNTHEVLETLRGIRVLKNAQNLGFIRSSNAAASMAFGDFLVFLNNDTEIQPGWLDELIGTFELVPDAGVAGSKLIYPDGRLQEAGGIIWHDGSAWNYGRFEDASEPRFNYLRAVDYCSGASLAIPRELFLHLGGFDEHYLPAYGEDSDLAFRVRQAGKRVYYQPLSAVLHHEGVTSGASVSGGVKSFQVENSCKLFERWRGDIANLHAPGSDPDEAKDGIRSGRVLVLDHCTPTPDQDAGSITALNLMRLLQAHGYQLTFIPEDNFLHLPEYTADLQRVGVEVLHAPHCTSVEQHLESCGSRYDAVLIFRPTVAERRLPAVERYCPAARILYHTTDLHFLRMFREADLNGANTGLAEAAAQMRETELDVMRRSHAVIVHSAHEAKVLREEHTLENVHVFQWAIDVPGTRTGYSARSDLCFVGGYQHPPNVDAVEHFVANIFPYIRKALPDIRFYAVGSNPPEKLKALEGNGVTVTGFVKDLGAFLERVRVAVAPLRYGAGIKGKLGTTLAAGLPSVATSSAAEGMGLSDGDNLVLANDPMEFAQAVIGLYTSPEKWAQISDSGVAFAERTYGFENATSVVAGILQQVGLGARTAEEAHANLRIIDSDREPDRTGERSLELRLANVTEAYPHPDVRFYGSMEAFDRVKAQQENVSHLVRDAEQSLLPDDHRPSVLEGYCVVCRAASHFSVDYQHAAPANGSRPLPNWREQLVCRTCALNNRLRAAINVFELALRPTGKSQIYATEQLTPLLGWLEKGYPDTVGSEFLGSGCAPGQVLFGTRHEDLTDLSFSGSSLDFVLSFDVLQHVPDYEAALREFFRCLRPGGWLLMTAPFAYRAGTLVRARQRPDGSVEQLMPPEFSRVPASPDRGLLCYYHFGWDFLDALRRSGAGEAGIVGYYSFEGVNLGPEQLLFIARR